MRLKLLLTDDTTDCLYRIGEKANLISIFNTFDIFSFGQFYTNHSDYETLPEFSRVRT